MTNENNNNRFKCFTELTFCPKENRKTPHKRLSTVVRRPVRSAGSTTGPRSKGPRMPTNKCASRSLSGPHKALPYSSPLPLRSDIPGTAETLAATRNGSQTLGTRRSSRRARLRRSPEAPRAVQHPAESAQFSAPWTVSAALPPVGAEESCRQPAARAGTGGRSGPLDCGLLPAGATDSAFSSWGSGSARTSSQTQLQTEAEPGPRSS